MNSNFTVIEAEYRIVTPMFCAGANPDDAELRLPSFKGALRFWWRSLMWGQGGDRTREIGELWRKEMELFGAADKKFGQSKVRLRLLGEELEPSVPKGAVFEKGELAGAHYLGYGVMEAFASRNKGTRAGQLQRAMIPGGGFIVQLHLGPKLSSQQQRQIEHAMILLGTVGGLGSKSRKGFGSLTLTRLHTNGRPLELSAHPKERLNAVLRELPIDLPEWTAWSAQGRCLTVLGDGHRPVELLDELGREQVHFRSWGRNGRVLGAESEQNFTADHGLSKGETVTIEHPERIAFGLPHNYQTGGVKPAKQYRRASPLFLHVHQVSPEARPIGVVSFLPARFLPEGEKIDAFGTRVPLDTSDRFWNPIHSFLDRLIGDPKATKKKTNLQASEVEFG